MDVLKINPTKREDDDDTSKVSPSLETTWLKVLVKIEIALIMEATHSRILLDGIEWMQSLVQRIKKTWILHLMYPWL